MKTRPPFYLTFLVLSYLLTVLSCTQYNKKMMELPVRIHVINSTNQYIDANISNSEIEELMIGTNKVWKQAGIKWEIESIIPSKISNEEEITNFFENPKDMEYGRLYTPSTVSS